ncbi:MAG: hypothetical protein M3O61_08300 [Gemmatimonadota bacterium]|nr:hypothetical protein [Gemmatimonadota bacterium]
MNPDFSDILEALTSTGARFLVVGAHALAVHGVPRATGDLDVWVDVSTDNAELVWRALAAFGAPVESLKITPEDFSKPDMVVQVGLPPQRIDFLTGVSGLTFADAWADRVTLEVGAITVPFLGRASLVRNKRASGRLKDLADLEALGEKPTTYTET